MSFSISTLLTRNLNDVFGENDPARRRAAIGEIFAEDCVFYDPGGGVYRGRDEIDRVAGAIRAAHPDFRYQPIAPPEESGNGGRIGWVEGRPGEADSAFDSDGTGIASSRGEILSSTQIAVKGNCYFADIQSRESEEIQLLEEGVE